MFGNYLAIALRTFRRRPLTTAVNVIALALGLTCFVAAYAVIDIGTMPSRASRRPTGPM